MQLHFFPFIVYSPGPKVGLLNHKTFCAYDTHLINIISSWEARKRTLLGASDKGDIQNNVHWGTSDKKLRTTNLAR